MVKNIIFDFGDVFINLDKQATAHELSRLGLADFTQEMLAINQDYEKGLVDSETFAKAYQKLLPEMGEEALATAWNAIILDFPEYRLLWLETLASRGDFRLFLLSNTNALHIEKVKANMSQKHYERFKACFERFYLSHQIHMRKPDAEIYRFVLEENNLEPGETLFVDDTRENTESAAKLGIHTWTLSPETDDVIALLTAKNELF